MSKLLSNERDPEIKWNPWLGVLYAILVFVVAQVLGLVIIIYPLIIRHWTLKQTLNWLSVSSYGQFFYVVFFEAIVVGIILYILKLYRVDKKAIGLRRPRSKDALYGLAGLFVYYLIFILAVIVVSYFVKGFNVNQKQNVGFNNVHGSAQLIIVFFSLVIVPPIAEEILFRGFLYSSLKKGLPIFGAAIVTSLIFASGHLTEGVGGLLWIGALDTFVLSMVLVYLREKTNGLWAGMLVHALKNGIAFYLIYIAPLMLFH
jgi:hypothetical protein